MAAIVRIPTPLRKLTSNQSEVQIEGGTIDTILSNMDSSYPGIKSRICDDAGNIRRFINVYVNEEDIRFLEGPGTSVKDGDKISIVPAIAGGA